RAGKRIEAAIRSRYDLLIGCIGTCRIQLVLLAGDGVDMTIVRELAGIQNSVVVVEGGTGVGIEKISHEVFGQKAVRRLRHERLDQNTAGMSRSAIHQIDSLRSVGKTCLLVTAGER